MAKKAKNIENRLRSTEHVAQAATVHRAQVTSSLAALAVEVQGSTTNATREVFEVVVDFITAALKHAGTKLDAAELSVVAEKADDVGLREMRDAHEITTRNSCVRIKSMVADALGDNALAVYGLEGPTPRGAREVLTHARTVVELLQKTPFQKTVDGVTYDSASIAMGLATKAEALAHALGDVDREEQELRDKLGIRDMTLGTWTEAYQGGADTLVGLFRLAGRKDLSEAVRPTPKMVSGEDVAPEVEDAPPVGPTEPGP